MPSPTPELVQAVVAAFTFLGGVWLAWWRITSRVHAFIAAQVATSLAVDKLRQEATETGDEVAERLFVLAADVGSLKADVGRLSTLMGEREKDVSRLEGQIDQLGSLIVKQVAAVHAATASLDAVWRTLQVLHPDKVPRRASDRS